MNYQKSLDALTPVGPAVQMPTTDTTITEDGYYRFYAASGMYVAVSDQAISFAPNYNNAGYVHYNGGWEGCYLKAGDHIKSNSSLGSYQRFA